MAASGDDPGLGGVTFVLMALATVALELALAEPDCSASTSIVTTLSMVIAPTLGVALCLAGRTARNERTHEHPRARPQNGCERGFVLLLFVLFALPFAGQFVSRTYRNGSSPMAEVLLMAALRNVGLGLAATASRPVCARLCAVVSLFLVLLAASLGEGKAVLAFVGIYAVVGAYWLMLYHWKRLALSTSDSTGAGRLPWSATIWLAAASVAFFFATTLSPIGLAMTLPGLAPTSGGTDTNDPEARGGVNDGDNEVAASKNPRSVGFTQSEVYLDTDRPSLYDTFSDTYGEPYVPKRRERMLAIPPGGGKELTERPAENLRAGREFSLIRRNRESTRNRPRDRDANALVYVKGPTPLHLRLTAFDAFDGKTWHEEPPAEFTCPLSRDGNGAWLRLQHPASAIYASSVSHQIKIGTLESASLPVPGNLERLKVGSVDRPDFFGWAQDGILQIVGRTVPAGTVIDTEAKVVDPRRLTPGDFHRTNRLEGRYLQPSSPAIRALAESWSAARPHGWPQVEAIAANLRRSYTHDRLAAPHVANAAPVEVFLFESKRGPDYQFATAAVLLLRSLDYPARLVSGFYANPARYDYQTRHTPVLPEDVHFWAEVRTASGAWINVDPTPGYDLLEPTPGLAERLSALAFLVSRWLSTNRLALGSALIALALGLRYRHNALDRLATLAWRWQTWRTPGRCVLATVDLIERRSRWAGHRRPGAFTFSRWLGKLSWSNDAPADVDLNRFIRLSNWSLYAPVGASLSPALSPLDIRLTCDRVVQNWTLHRFRSRPAAPGPERKV